jgi:fumarylacetoacetase
MIDQVNATHDPNLKSWIKSANTPGADFPIQNLPFGVFRAGNEKTNPRIGVAIGDKILDVKISAEAGLLYGDWCGAPNPNPLMALSPADRSALRLRLSELLRSDSGHRSRMESTPGLFTPIAEAEMVLPSAIGDYTDFYASIHHATNVGKLFRPDNPLLPNYKWVPIGYHGRASSVVVSGTPVRRPNGQTQAGDGPPVFGPTKALDYELEVGLFTGSGNKLGEAIPIAAAEEHIFGLCLVNDWSARDMQRWEYQPLGPFLSKSFATSISPWVVTLEALAPFRVGSSRPPEDPQPLNYLAGDQSGIDLTLEVRLVSQCMKAAGIAPMLLSRGNLRDLYWTFAQLLTHHSSNGCNIRPGDLIASGTVSGPSPDSRGCLLEITAGGSLIELPGGETRRFLADGDEVIITGYAEREGCARIGFGECRGVVLPATGPEYRT